LKEDPVVFALTDRISRYLGFLTVALLLAASLL
jgi:hypothetical protein